MKELAAFCSVSVDQLNNHLLKKLDFGNVVNDDSKIIVNDLFDVSMNATAMLLRFYLGSPRWIEMLIEQKKINTDFTRIIEDYYMLMICKMYNEYEKRGENFTKIALSREWKIDSGRDLLGISFMYCLEVMENLVSYIHEEYYKNYSWENMLNVNRSVAEHEMVEYLKGNNRLLKSQIETLQNTIDGIKKTEQSNNENNEFRNEVIKLNRIIDEKNQEVLSLKEKLQLYDEFENIKNQSLESDDFILVDSTAVISKRFLFVGRITDQIPEIKRLFPGSLFMEKESYSIREMKVDAIVLMIKYMNHAMYYKIKETIHPNETRLIYCNTHNINRVIYDIYNQIQ